MTGPASNTSGNQERSIRSRLKWLADLRYTLVSFVVLLLTAGARMTTTPSGSESNLSPEGSAIDAHEESSVGRHKPPAGASTGSAVGPALSAKVGPAQSAPSGITTPNTSNAAV